MIDTAFPVEPLKRGHDRLADFGTDLRVGNDHRHDRFERKALGENHTLQVDEAFFETLGHEVDLSSVNGSPTIAEAGGVTSLARGGCSILCACNACENPFRSEAA